MRHSKHQRAMQHLQARQQHHQLRVTLLNLHGFSVVAVSKASPVLGHWLFAYCSPPTQNCNVAIKSVIQGC